MNSGLLWYDPDPKKPTATKVAEAIRRYKERFDLTPNACYVCPAFAQVVSERDALRPLGVALLSNRWIRPGYFWIGIDEEATVTPSSTPRVRRLPTEGREPVKPRRALQPVA